MLRPPEVDTNNWKLMQTAGKYHMATTGNWCKTIGGQYIYTHINLSLNTENNTKIHTIKGIEPIMVYYTDDDLEIVEESPCGRWHRMDDQKPTRQSPIRAETQDIYLAMDTEEGLEVLWCEIRYQNNQELRQMKDMLTEISLIHHDHLIAVHDFWPVEKASKMVVITQSGTYTPMKFYLDKVKGNGRSPRTRQVTEWLRQLVPAMTHVHQHGLNHGNITTANIFIQQDGAIKLGLPLLKQNTEDEREAMRIRDMDHRAIQTCRREIRG